MFLNVWKNIFFPLKKKENLYLNYTQQHEILVNLNLKAIRSWEKRKERNASFTLNILSISNANTN